MADEKPEYDEAMAVYNSLNDTQKSAAGSFMSEAAKLYTDSNDGQIPADILKKSMDDIRDGKDPYLNLPKKQNSHGGSLDEKVEAHGSPAKPNSLDKILEFPTKLLDKPVLTYAAAASLLLYLII